MATEAEIQSKRESIKSLREQANRLRQERQAADTAAGRDAKLASLTAEEQSLEQELSALRASAPKKAAPQAAAATPKPASSDAAENKE